MKHKTTVQGELFSEYDFPRYFNGFSNLRYRGEDGKPITRTPETNPYNYEPFVVWENVELLKATDSVYADRLYQWDYKKHNELCLKIFGDVSQYWDKRSPENIESFLQQYNERADLQLTKIVQYCNASSGYPTWRFDFFYNPEKLKPNLENWFDV